MNAYIKQIEYYLPKKSLSNEDLFRLFPDWTPEKIFSKVGIKNRFIADENETAVDMAVKVAEKLFKNNTDCKNSIDFLLFCTQSPDYKLPTSACIIQDKLGLPKSIGALDYNLGCSGYIYGLSMAKGFILSGVARNILLITSETYSKYIDFNDKGNRSIFGDAATATVISTDGVLRINDFSFGTDGSGFEKLIVKTGSARFPSAGTSEESKLYMNGQDIFQFTIKEVPNLVESLLAKNRLSISNIDYFLFHQANVFILEYLRKKMNISKEKFPYFIENIGNTVSNSIPILLNENLNCILKNPISKIMLIGFGVGLSWGGCVLEVT
ncbi:MAG: ketoacyl-ACP synthase III [Treponema sp.]|nr:ketoacyl-ACP synthase III [Treponema sp.]